MKCRCEAPAEDLAARNQDLAARERTHRVGPDPGQAPAEDLAARNQDLAAREGTRRVGPDPGQAPPNLPPALRAGISLENRAGV